jgi:uncharacterized protein with FMN-binding domain
MKRAILVSSGTLAGLVAVLTYSGADVPAAIAAGPVDSNSQGALGGPPPLDQSPAPDASASGDPAPADSASPSPSAAAPSASPTKAAASAKPSATPTKAGATKAATAPTKAAAPAPAPTKAAPKPTPTPTKTASVAKDYVGSLLTHKYGKVQVGIRVKDGKIIAVWPVVYPNGPSQPYSDFSIPVLKSETLRAQGPGIANVSGATLTWQAWKSSLQSAMSKAGI